MNKTDQNVKQEQVQQVKVKACSYGHRYTGRGICLVCWPGRIDKEKLQAAPSMMEEEKAVFRQGGFEVDGGSGGSASLAASGAPVRHASSLLSGHALEAYVVLRVGMSGQQREQG